VKLDFVRSAKLKSKIFLFFEIVDALSRPVPVPPEIL